MKPFLHLTFMLVLVQSSLVLADDIGAMASPEESSRYVLNEEKVLQARYLEAYLLRMQRETHKQTRLNLAKIKSNGFIGVEVMIAERLKGQAESRWGHAFLRLVDDDQNPMNDLVVSFYVDMPIEKQLAALTGNDYELRNIWLHSKFLLGALTGFAKMDLVIMPVYEFIVNYVAKEVRSISRVIVPTSEKQRQNILLFLEAFQDGKVAKPYSLLTRNCLTTIQSLFNFAGLPSFSLMSSVPVHFQHSARMALLAPYPQLEFMNPQVATVKVESVLGFKFETRNDISNLKVSDLQGRIEELDKLTLYRFYLINNFQLSADVKSYWAEVTRGKTGRYTKDEVYGASKVPAALYDLNSVGAMAVDMPPTDCRRLREAISYRRSLPLMPEVRPALDQHERLYRLSCRGPKH